MANKVVKAKAAEVKPAAVKTAEVKETTKAAETAVKAEAVANKAEAKAENPVIRISMFTEDKAFAFSNIAALLNYGATFAISYLMSIYLQVIMGYTSQTAGLILIAQPLMQALFSPMMGKLSDRIPPYKLATAGMCFCVVGLGLFAMVGLETSIIFIVAALMLSG